MLRLEPRLSLYALGVVCFFVLGPLFSMGVWLYPWGFKSFRSAAMIVEVPWSAWSGLVLLPIGWVALAASVRATRQGIALYVLGALLYRLTVRIAFPGDSYSGLLESPELTIIWPSGVWQVVGYALNVVNVVGAP